MIFEELNKCKEPLVNLKDSLLHKGRIGPRKDRNRTTKRINRLSIGFQRSRSRWRTERSRWLRVRPTSTAITLILQRSGSSSTQRDYKHDSRIMMQKRVRRKWIWHVRWEWRMGLGGERKRGKKQDVDGGRKTKTKRERKIS